MVTRLVYELADEVAGERVAESRFGAEVEKVELQEQKPETKRWLLFPEVESGMKKMEQYVEKPIV